MRKYKIKDYYIVASRGRNKEVSGRWVQQLEILGKDYTNSITSVAKDNWLLVIYKET